MSHSIYLKNKTLYNSIEIKKKTGFLAKNGNLT